MLSHIESTLSGITVVLALGWFACRFLMSQLTSRDLVWRTALVIVAIMPVISIARTITQPWQWSVAVLPSISTVQSAKTSVASANKPRMLPRRNVVRSLPPVESNDVSFDHVTVVEDSDRGIEAHESNTMIRVPEIPVSTAARTVATKGFGWNRFLIGIWLVGIVWNSARLGLAVWRAGVLVKSASPVTNETHLAMNEWAARRVGLREQAALMTSRSVEIPVVCGLIWPKIIVPGCLLAETSHAQLRAGLLHEYGHVRRRDLAYELLLKFVVAVYWWHPLVLMMASELRRLREEICDNFVLSEESPIFYSEMLLQFAVANRWRDGMVLGLGMLKKNTRLEDRVDGILASDRSLKTQPSPWVRRSMAAVVGLLVLASALVRLDRAIIAPIQASQSIDSEPESDSVVTNDPAGNTTRRAVGEPEKTLDFLFTVVTTEGKPVEGAKVKTWSFNGAHFGEEKMPGGITDAKGLVKISFPAEISSFHQKTHQVQFPRVALRIDHPNHPIWSQEVQIVNDQRLVLSDSTSIRVSAHRTDHPDLLNDLYPMFSAQSIESFDQADGILTIPRVDLTGPKPSRLMRIVHVPDGGPVLFSNVIDLQHLAGNPIELDVTLKPGIRIEGRLSDDVPRPVKKGRIIGATIDGSDRDNTVGWGIAVDVAADGSFAIESVPQVKTLQLVAICDGWVSRSPSKQEVNAYAKAHQITGLQGTDPGACSVSGQFIELNAAVIETTIAMEPTTSCEVIVRDEKGNPLPEAKVSFWPNHNMHNWGSSLLGHGSDTATVIRRHLLTGDRDWKSTASFDEDKYTAITNEIGIAVVSGLPLPTNASEVGHQALFSVSHERYVAVSNAEGQGAEYYQFGLLVAKLSHERTESITVRMKPITDLMKPSALSGLAGQPENESEGTLDRSLLSGRVVNDEGQPIGGVNVILCDDDSMGIVTDSEGRFKYKFEEEMVGGPEAICFPVRFVAAGYASTNVRITLDGREKAVTMGNKTRIEGTIRNPDGTPAVNANIRSYRDVRMEDFQENFTASYETRSDDKGHFRLLVEAGYHHLVCDNSRDAIAWLPKSDKQSDDDVEDDEADSRSARPILSILSQETKLLDIQLEPSCELHCRFINSVTRLPVPKVHLVPSTDEQLDRYPVSDEQGMVTIPLLPAGEMSFGIYENAYSGFWSDDASPKWKNANQRKVPTNGQSPMIDRSSMSFVLKPGVVEATVLLEPAVNIRGQVLDPEGHPVADAQLKLIRPENGSSNGRFDRFEIATNAEGKFQGHFPPSRDGRYNLLVMEQRRRFASISIGNDLQYRWGCAVSPLLETKPGQTIENLELRFSRPATIRGRLVDKSGTPLVRAVIYSIAVDHRDGRQDNPVGRSDASGNFEIRFVRPGQHYLTTQDPMKHLATAQDRLPTVEVQEGESINVGDVSTAIKE